MKTTDQLSDKSIRKYQTRLIDGTLDPVAVTMAMHLLHDTGNGSKPSHATRNIISKWMGIDPQTTKKYLDQLIHHRYINLTRDLINTPTITINTKGK